MADVESPSSIIVSVENPDVYGIKDKLKLLFQRKSNGGSNVRDVHRLGITEFQVEFVAGSDAVKRVCEYLWELEGKSLIVKPNLKSLRNQIHSERQSSYKDLNSSRSESREKVELTKMEKRYLELHNPDVWYVTTSGTEEKRNWGFLFEIRQKYTSLLKKMPFPSIHDYLTLSKDGQKIKKDIEMKHSCVIDKGEDEKKCGANFKVTVLATACMEKLKIHLVQGSATDMVIDASLHIEYMEHEDKRGSSGLLKKTIYVKDPDAYCDLLENELKSFLSQDISTLAISLSSKLAEKMSLDDFAEIVLQNLEKFYKGRSNMHIFLCENYNSALFEAYKYFLLSSASVWMPQIDHQIWEKISHKNFPAEHTLSKKVQVVDSIRHNSHKDCLVYLPISQNLHWKSCPYDVSGLNGLENSVKYLHMNMTEEEKDNFFVGSTHCLPRPRNAQMTVHLYCTQDWTFGVAKSIGYTLNACLKVSSDIKDPEVYIYPPGVSSKSAQYPVKFVVQKCLQTLLEKEHLLEKISTLYLVVPETQYRLAFKDMLDSRSSSSSFRDFFKGNSLEYKPESYLEIYGLKPQEAFHDLKERLKGQMCTEERELADNNFHSFKNYLQTSPPVKIHVTVKDKKVKVSGLSASVVQEFLKKSKLFFRNLQHTQPFGHSSAKTSTSPNDSSNPRQNFKPTQPSTFKWSHISDSREKKFFSVAISSDIEKAFQQQQNIEIRLKYWKVSLFYMTCTKPKMSGVQEYLLRNEDIKDLNIEKGGNREQEQDEGKGTPLYEVIKENLKIDKIFRIDNESLKKRFEYKKRSSPSLKCYESLWIQVEDQWASRIAYDGFQKLFSSNSAANTAFFSKRPKYDSTKSQFTLLFCDVLCDSSSVVQDQKHPKDIWITIEYTKMSDAQILPRFLYRVYH